MTGPHIDREEVLEHSDGRFRARLTISFEGSTYDVVASFDTQLKFAWILPLDNDVPVRVERAARSFVEDYCAEVTARLRALD